MDKQKRTITCMTGTRADYPRVKSVLREISSRPNLELKLIVTGMHLLKKFGYTVKEIEQDGFYIAAIKANEEFKEHLNIWVKRPGSGIPSYELPNIVGKRASRNLPANYLLKPEDIVD